MKAMSEADILDWRTLRRCLSSKKLVTGLLMNAVMKGQLIPCNC